MLPSKLKRHLETNRFSMVEESRELSNRKLQDLHKHKNVFTRQSSVPSNVLLAPFKIAYRVAKCKGAALDTVNIILGESAEKLIQRYLSPRTLLTEEFIV